jgi:hypothetical protein
MNLVELADLLAPKTKEDLEEYKNIENYQTNEKIDTDDLEKLKQ